jgi:hypothetical protein
VILLTGGFYLEKNLARRLQHSRHRGDVIAFPQEADV